MTDIILSSKDNMKNQVCLFIIVAAFLASCINKSEHEADESINGPADRPVLDLKEAERLAELPLACVEREYPNKLNQTIGSDDDLLPPRVLHPSFYGCFDWHSSVHGHWSLVILLKHYPKIGKAQQIRSLLKKRITPENIKGEIDYFLKEGNKTFERTYGWAWLLKLAEELYNWDTELGKQLYGDLKPLAEVIAGMYREFLPRLYYPIRVGTHTNTAFGLSFAYDYAISTGDDSLAVIIKQRAKDFYFYDTDCPIGWEPGGNDFLSPCLEEANIMRRVLDNEDYKAWLNKFLPELSDPSFSLEPGIVSDRSDGQLAHLDGLNFSRAWCLYGIASTDQEYNHLKRIADRHIAHSLPSISDGHYEGGHWLASFALMALDSQTGI